MRKRYTIVQNVARVSQHSEKPPLCAPPRPRSLYEMSHSDPALVSARKVTEAVLTECLKRPDDLRRAYERFEYLLVTARRRAS